MDFTEKDFKEGTTVLDYINTFDNPVERLQKVDEYSKLAKEYKITNFKKQWAVYEKELNKVLVESGGLYTDFEGLEKDGEDLNLLCQNWDCDESGVSQVVNMNGAKVEVKACPHPIIPVERLINIETNEEKIKLAYKRRKNHWKEIIVDKLTLSTNNKITDLARWGISVTSDTARFLVKYLNEIENENYERIPETNSISRLGWIDGYGFSPYVKNLVFDGDNQYRAIYESMSESGDFGKWLGLVKAIRNNGVTARMMLAGSFSSVLIKKIGGLPFFIHLFGGTEAGKTVGLMLAASVWGNPEEGKYLRSCEATDVFLQELSSFLNNTPLILDELQLIRSKKNFDQTIYKLTEGVGKGQGKKNGGVRDSKTWKNCILTSGETPITNSNSGGGAVNRIIEIECLQSLFHDPREVAETVKKNYGFAGKIFVEWLEEEENVNMAKDIFKDFNKQLEKEDTTSKQAMAMAMILTADKIITDLLFTDDKDLKVYEIVQFLKSKESVSASSRGYIYVYETVAANKRRFSTQAENNETWGVEDNDFFYIYSSRFEKICQEGGYDQRTLLRWMKENDKVETSTKGFSKSKWHCGNSISFIWLKKSRKPVEQEVKANDINF